MKRIHVWIALTFICISCKDKRYSDPLTPEEALKSFTLNDDFNIEIFAAEPFIADPVDLTFDEDGNAYVVEMPDYPYKPEPGKGRGRIKFLADTNGDGRVDQATIFIDSIAEATSVLPWNGGLLVAAAPNIWFMKDTTGDHKADVKQIWYRGFFQNNSEAQITNLRFGIDNWIYASNHGQDGNIHSQRSAGKDSLSVRSADFRFRPDKDVFEQETGPGQFGHTFDDWGNRFVTQNTIRLQHMVTPWRYLHRHEFLPSKRGMKDITNGDLTMFQETPPPYWRAERTARRTKEYAEQNIDRKEYAEDHFTGASGGTYYGGQTFPAQYLGNIFIGDVSGNLVHRDLLTPLADSPTFFAGKDSINEKDREFLSSKDPWFRPANFTVGPDGALYVVDFYRQHIETPVSIPEDLKTDMDFMAGSDKGRIYRITPKNPVSKNQAKPKLSKMTSAELVALLEHPGQWWRIQAQRLLLERQDKTVIPAATDLFANSKNSKARLHAFFVLEGLNALTPKIVSKAMNDPELGVRVYGVMLAERYPALLPEVISRTSDSSVRVAYQATLSLGQFDPLKTTATFAKILEKRFQNSWFRTAVLSSKAGYEPELLKILAAGPFFQTEDPDKAKFLRDYAYVNAAADNTSGVLTVLRLSDTQFKAKSWRMAMLGGLADGMKTSAYKPGMNEKKLLLKLVPGSDKEVQEAVKQIVEL